MDKCVAFVPLRLYRDPRCPRFPRPITWNSALAHMKNCDVFLPVYLSNSTTDAVHAVCTTNLNRVKKRLLPLRQRLSSWALFQGATSPSAPSSPLRLAVTARDSPRRTLGSRRFSSGRSVSSTVIGWYC